MPEENFETGLEKGVKPFSDASESSDAPAAPMPGQNFESDLVSKSNGPVKTASGEPSINSRTDGEEITEEVYSDTPATDAPESTEAIVDAPVDTTELPTELPSEETSETTEGEEPAPVSEEDAIADTDTAEAPASDIPAEEGAGDFFGGDEDEASMGMGGEAPAADLDEISFEDDDQPIESDEPNLSDEDFSFDAEDEESDEDAQKTAKIQSLVNDIFGRK
jgi:hypothetical protein